MTERLEAKTAKHARKEIASKFPEGAEYKGYDEDGECVLMSLVRPKGVKAGVATVSRNRSKPAVRFECEPLPKQCTCVYVGADLPMNQKTCLVHTKPKYECSCCDCSNYTPKGPPTPRKDGIPGFYWGNCSCGHCAQDHN